jgi:hypothetical protein
VTQHRIAKIAMIANIAMIERPIPALLAVMAFAAMDVPRRVRS